MKKFISIALKVLVIALCFTVIFQKINFRDVAEKLADTRLSFVLLAFLTVLCEPVVMAMKWNLLLKTKGINARLSNLIRVIFTSNFLGVVIPTSVGADALRLLMLKGQQHSLTHTASSLIADRVLAVLALVVLSFSASLFIWQDIAAKQILWAVAGLAVVIIALIGALASPLPSALVPLVQAHLLPLALRLLPPGGRGAVERGVGRALHKLVDVHDSFRAFGHSLPTVGVVFGMNLAIQVLRTVQVHILFRAAHYPVPFSQEIVFVPVIILLTLLPISYFGLGIKEGAFLFFFGQVGVPPAICLTVSFITYILIFSALLPGAYFFLRRPPELPRVFFSGRRPPGSEAT